MAPTDDASKTPLEFRLRALSLSLAYFIGFAGGRLIQGGVTPGSIEPTFVRLGAPWGSTGVEFFVWLAVAFAVAAWLVRWWGSSYHSAGVVMSGDLVADTLTVAGPYRYVRNPLYFGNILLAISIGSLGPPPAFILVVALNLVVVYRLIVIEERFLRTEQGDAYARYCAAVPRLLPRLTPAPLPPDPRKPDVRYGFVTELFALGFAIAMAYFAAVVAPAQGRGHLFMFVFLIIAAAIVIQSLLTKGARRARGTRP